MRDLSRQFVELQGFRSSGVVLEMEKNYKLEGLYKPQKTDWQSINNIAAFVLGACCLWPSFGGKTLVVFVAIAVWIATAFLGKYGTFVLSSNNGFMYFGMLGWMLITALMIIVNPEFNAGGLYTGLMTGVICIETIRNNLINHDFSAIKTFAFCSCILYVIVIARALLIGGSDSNVYRLNITSGFINETIGNFGLYYSVVFTIPIALFILFDKGCKNKWLAFALLGVSVVLLLFAQYTIALIIEIATFFVWLSVAQGTKRENQKSSIIWIVIIVIVCIVVAVFAEDLLAKPLLKVANSLQEDSPIKQRLQDLVLLIRGESSDGNLAADRLERYRDSIMGFFSHPIFGGNIYSILGIELGGEITKAGHNSIFEMFRLYGLIFAIPYFMLIFSILKKILAVWKKIKIEFYSILLAVVVAYFMLSCLNPIFNLFSMSWLFFNFILVAPLAFNEKGLYEKFCMELSKG